MILSTGTKHPSLDMFSRSGKSTNNQYLAFRQSKSKLTPQKNNDFMDDADLSGDDEYSKILVDKKETVQKVMDDIVAEQK